MRLEVRWVVKPLLVGVIAALSASGCSNEATRSALQDEGVQAQASTWSEVAPASATPGASGAAKDTSPQGDGPAAALEESSATASSEGSGQPGRASGQSVSCPNRAVSCKPWPERPASEGWIEEVLCPDRYSRTRVMGLHNLTTVSLVVAVRNMDCNAWSVTGNPGQITGTRLEPGMTAPMRWLLEPASYHRGSYNFDIGVFIRNRDGSLDYRGVAEFAGSLTALRSVNGDLLQRTNTGRALNPNREAGYRCVQQALGADPNQWKTTQEFNWGPMSPGEISTLVSIYSDGANLYAVQCGRGDAVDF